MIFSKTVVGNGSYVALELSTMIEPFMCSRTMKRYLNLGAPEREPRTRILKQEVYLGGEKESRRQ